MFRQFITHDHTAWNVLGSHIFEEYAANNPMKYIDINGDSINVSELMVADFETLAMTLLDLADQTGLSIGVNSSGNLTYGKNSKTGEALVASVDGVEQGSGTARSDLISAIKDSEQTVKVGPSNIGSGTPPGSNRIWLDGTQIQQSIDDTPKDLNNRTMGYGLTFFHELYHTRLGGQLQDPSDRSDVFSKGKAVEQVNKIRGELDSNSYNFNRSQGFYGQREHYFAIPGTKDYVTFKLPKGKRVKVYPKTFER